MDLNRIENAFTTKQLDDRIFERFAQDVLSEVFPGLVPLPGGSDWGRDADVAGTSASTPPRLLVTSSQTFDGVKANMLRGIASMTEHGVPYDEIMLANPASLSQLQRQKLIASAKSRNARLDVAGIFDRHYFASKLRRDGYWRHELLGLPSDPLSLSPVPTELAESPWRDLPLVGRDLELGLVAQDASDLIVIGSPGVGKSRLIKEISGVAFIDRDAEIRQVQDDLRLYQPLAVVVDDCVDQEKLIRQLIRVRQVEADIQKFRLILSCWPEDVETVCQWLTRARRVEIGLLERKPIDKVLVAMGITHTFARYEILKQAEGRIGWAIALGDLLIRRHAESLLNGKALLGAASKFLGRAGMAPETITVLALVAALDGVDDFELDKLAAEVSMTRAQLVSVLIKISRSGLIDAESRQFWTRRQILRTFQVRPPTLAKALIVEQAFHEIAAAFTLELLLERWPDRLTSLAQAAIYAAGLDAPKARQVAERLFKAAVNSTDASTSDVLEMAEEFACLDRGAAELVLRIIQSEVAPWLERRETGSWHRVEPLTRIAAVISRRFELPAALDLILDLGVQDMRETNPHPGHPIRVFDDLCTDFHPELPFDVKMRISLARQSLAWIRARAADSRHLEVFAKALKASLSPHLHASYPEPADPATICMVRTVLLVPDMESLYQASWPHILTACREAPHITLPAAISIAVSWSRIGTGGDLPFGQPHPAERIEKAKLIGDAMFADLADLKIAQTGLAQRLYTEAKRFEVNLPEPTKTDESFLFMPFRARTSEEAAAERASLTALSEAWIAARRHLPPRDLLGRISGIKDELEVAQEGSSARLSVLMSLLADAVDDPLAWLIKSIDLGLLSEARAFVPRVLASRKLSNELIRQLMAVPSLRSAIVDFGLRDTNIPEDVRGSIIANLSTEDFSTIENLFLRGQVSDEVFTGLFDHADHDVQVMAAFAVFQADDRDKIRENEVRWFRAISKFRPVKHDFVGEQGFVDLLEFMTTAHLGSVSRFTLDILLTSEDPTSSISPRVWDVLCGLSHDEKEQLLTQFLEQAQATRKLMNYLVGADLSFLIKLMDQGRLGVDDAISAISLHSDSLQVTDVAKALIPRGVPAQAIAAMGGKGGWWGEESAHYQRLVDEFQMLIDSEDACLQEVGAAGVALYSKDRDRALVEEKRNRIRGEL